MEDWTKALIGHSIPFVTENSLVLDDGTRIEFTDNYDCCSWADLNKLRTCDNVITDVRIEDDDSGEGSYSAWVYAVTDKGGVEIVNQDSNASNGYYLHGFALKVRVIPVSR
jgi:hypothetical protein